MKEKKKKEKSRSVRVCDTWTLFLRNKFRAASLVGPEGTDNATQKIEKIKCRKNGIVVGCVENYF